MFERECYLIREPTIEATRPGIFRATQEFVKGWWNTQIYHWSQLRSKLPTGAVDLGDGVFQIAIKDVTAEELRHWIGQMQQQA